MRDLLPSAAALAASREAIIGWWDEAWRGDDALDARFGREAGAALPVAAGSPTDQVFEGLSWRRLRLQQDQRLAEWAGAVRDRCRVHGTLRCTRGSRVWIAGGLNGARRWNPARIRAYPFDTFISHW